MSSAALPEPPADSTPEDIEVAFRSTQSLFREGVTRSYEWRMTQVKACKRLLVENREAINAAVYKDLRRPTCVTIILFHMKYLNHWSLVFRQLCASRISQIIVCVAGRACFGEPRSQRSVARARAGCGYLCSPKNQN